MSLSTSSRACQILGSGVYSPSQVTTSEEIDKRLGLPEGTIQNKSGVYSRYFAENETVVQMGTQAALRALESSGLKPENIDLIIGACGVGEQPIPSTAALIHRELGLGDSGIPAFDMNSTCLSFVTAFDTASYLINSGRFNRILIVSSEKASVGINWKHLESAALFGDGAAAFVVAQPKFKQHAGIIESCFRTYSSEADTCQIKGGLTGLPGYAYNQKNSEDYLFHMDGRRVFKLAAQILPGMFSEILSKNKMSSSDLALVIPHQASASAMELIRRRLDIDEKRWMSVVQNYGNLVAASVPTALHQAIIQKRIQRGDQVLLLGSSAGMSFGLVLFEY